MSATLSDFVRSSRALFKEQRQGVSKMGESENESRGET